MHSTMSRQNSTTRSDSAGDLFLGASVGAEKTFLFGTNEEIQSQAASSKYISSSTETHIHRNPHPTPDQPSITIFL